VISVTPDQTCRTNSGKPVAWTRGSRPSAWFTGSARVVRSIRPHNAPRCP